MPEGRAARAVEALAKSIDGAEHNATINLVMAGVQIATQPGRTSRRTRRATRSGS